MIDKIQIPSPKESTLYVNSNFKDSGYVTSTFAKKIFNEDEYFRFSTLKYSKEIAPFASSCGPGVTLSNSEPVKIDHIKIPEMHFNQSVELCNSLDTQYWVNSDKIKFARGMTKKQKIEMGIFDLIQKQKLAIDLQKEKMAVDLLNTGKVNTSSSYANGQIVDFKRDPLLASFALAPAQYFDNPTSSPLWEVLVNVRTLLKAHSFVFSDVILSNKAFTAFIQHQEVRKLFELSGNPYGMPSPLATLMTDVTVRNIQGINFHIYDEIYTEYQTGVTTRFLDENRAIFIGRSGGTVPLWNINAPVNSMRGIMDGRENQDIYTEIYGPREGGNGDNVSIMSKSSPLIAGFANCAVSSQVIA
jgi:Phage major capsid protein E